MDLLPILTKSDDLQQKNALLLNIKISYILQAAYFSKKDVCFNSRKICKKPPHWPE